MCQRPFVAEESAKHLTKRKLHTTHVGAEGSELLCKLMSPNRDETAAHDCHCSGNMAVRRGSLYVCHLLLSLLLVLTLFIPVMITIMIIMIMTTMFGIQNPNTGLKISGK